MFSSEKFGKGNDSVSCFFFRKRDYPSQVPQKTWGKENNPILLDGCYRWNDKEYLFSNSPKIYAILDLQNSNKPQLNSPIDGVMGQNIVNKFMLHFRIEFVFGTLDLDQYLNENLVI